MTIYKVLIVSKILISSNVVYPIQYTVRILVTDRINRNWEQCISSWTVRNSFKELVKVRLETVGTYISNIPYMSR